MWFFFVSFSSTKKKFKCLQFSYSFLQKNHNEKSKKIPTSIRRFSNGINEFSNAIPLNLIQLKFKCTYRWIQNMSFSCEDLTKMAHRKTMNGNHLVRISAGIFPMESFHFEKQFCARYAIRYIPTHFYAFLSYENMYNGNIGLGPRNADISGKN